MLKIKRFEAKNIKRLKFVEIVPNPEGGLTIISGKNAQGKSSTLDSLAYLLGGLNLIPDKPIRAGEKSAHVLADMGEVIVRRDFTLKSSTLTITKKDGSTIRSPQAWLNERIGNFGFDPLEFTRLKPNDQRERMMGMVKMEVDIDKLDAASEVAYDKRTVVGRDVTRLNGAVKTLLVEIGDEMASIPKAEVSIADLTKELENGMDLQQKATNCDGAVESAKITLDGQISEKGKRFNEIEKLEGQIEVLKEHEAEWQAELKSREAKFEEAKNAIPDIGAIRVKLSGAEGINAKVRKVAEYKTKKAEAQGHKDTYDSYTALIEESAEIKEKALANADFPCPGLGFDETGVTYNGLPFEQASQAEQLQVSLSIAMLDNPEIRVILIKDGSLLDPENLAVMDKLTKDADYDVIIERVEEDAGSIVIEDGMVKNDGTT